MGALQLPGVPVCHQPGTQQRHINWISLSCPYGLVNVINRNFTHCRSRDAAWLAAQLLQAGLGGMRAELAKPGSGPGAAPAGVPAPQPGREPAAVAPAQAAPKPCGDPGLPALPEPARVTDLDAAPQPGSGSGQGHAPAGVPVQAPKPKREPAAVAPAHTPPQELQEEPQAVEREQVMSMPQTQSVAASAAQAGLPATQPDTLAPQPHPYPYPYPYPMTNGMPRRQNRRRARSRASWRPMTHDANCQCDACAAQDARWGQHQGQADAEYAHDENEAYAAGLLPDQMTVPLYDYIETIMMRHTTTSGCRTGQWCWHQSRDSACMAHRVRILAGTEEGTGEVCCGRG